MAPPARQHRGGAERSLSTGSAGNATEADSGDPERDLFLEAVSGAEPLADRAGPRRPGPPPRRAAPRRPRPAFTVERDGERIEGRSPGVSRLQLAPLRAGEIEPEDRLDLHGHDRASARRRLADFLSAAARAGRRCVLVIHGRGRRSPDGPVLRDEVVVALSRGPLSRQVRGFCSARPRHGGGGALYVLLRS